MSARRPNVFQPAGNPFFWNSKKLKICIKSICSLSCLPETGYIVCRAQCKMKIWSPLWKLISRRQQHSINPSLGLFFFFLCPLVLNKVGKTGYSRGGGGRPRPYPSHNHHATLNKKIAGHGQGWGWCSKHWQPRRDTIPLPSDAHHQPWTSTVISEGWGSWLQKSPQPLSGPLDRGERVSLVFGPLFIDRNLDP